MANFKFKLSKDQQKLLAGAVLGLAGGGYAYVAFFWSPISAKIEAAQKDIEKVEADIAQADREAARLPQLEKELAKLHEQAAAAEQELPKKTSKNAVADLLVTVDALASANHVSLLGFSPGKITTPSVYVELAYPLSVRGRFHDVGKFLAAISLETRIFNIKDVKYNDASPDSGEMMVNFTLLSYQYKD